MNVPSLLMLLASVAAPPHGNRLAYLDGPCDPYYPGMDTARLVTPQWIGQPEVEAAVVLAIDDMRETEKYERFLRPILQRLKRIDGRAPVSIMSPRVDPADARLPQWLEEGLSIETHTYDHPCPLFQGGDLSRAKVTFDRCIDLLCQIPNYRPVAFRMPCCDSMNSVSPRFFSEIFNRTTPRGHFLTVDSSVFLLFTSDDRQLPRSVVLDEGAHERFRPYVPADRIMVNLIENYPYPYVIGRLCWEIPPVMPSDWDAQHRNGRCSPKSVEDYKAAIDAVVIKQGVFSICFHPHGWIGNDQIVELVDYAASRYGRRIQFLTFREVYERLVENLLGGDPLRTAAGGDNGVRVLDVNNDGYMDVVVGNGRTRLTRIWDSARKRWHEAPFPVLLVDARSRPRPVRFAVLQPDGYASLFDPESGLWHFDGQGWIQLAEGARGKPGRGETEPWAVVFRDLDGDGICEWIGGPPGSEGLKRYRRSGSREWWETTCRPALPEGTALVDAKGRDAGLRFVDVDEDGHLDLVFSNAQRYSVHLFTSLEAGWSRLVLAG
ncbi:MAG TPA: dehydrogenase, partial [Planctomycetaceae bacterium]|nr:dehydrogenase [Planctomycetaceae bacterium]